MAKKQGEEYYIITSPDVDIPEGELIPVLWSKIPSDLFDSIPDYYAETVPALDVEGGCVYNRTVVFLRKVSKKVFDREEPDMLTSIIVPLSSGGLLYLGVDDESDDLEIDFDPDFEL